MQTDKNENNKILRHETLGLFSAGKTVAHFFKRKKPNETKKVEEFSVAWQPSGRFVGALDIL